MGPKILDGMVQTMLQPWFHGDIGNFFIFLL